MGVGAGQEGTLKGQGAAAEGASGGKEGAAWAYSCRGMTRCVGFPAPRRNAASLPSVWTHPCRYPPDGSGACGSGAGRHPSPPPPPTSGTGSTATPMDDKQGGGDLVMHHEDRLGQGIWGVRCWDGATGSNTDQVETPPTRGTLTACRRRGRCPSTRPPTVAGAAGAAAQQPTRPGRPGRPTPTRRADPVRPLLGRATLPRRRRSTASTNPFSCKGFLMVSETPVL